MNDENPNLSAVEPQADEPLDGLDLMEWIMRIEFLPPPLIALRYVFVEWASAAGLENIEMRHLDDQDVWEFRCNQGTNEECVTVRQVERWLGFFARGSDFKFAPGHFIAIVVNGLIAARF